MGRELTQFKPGNPGGPGRPKGSLSLTTILKNALKKKSVMNNDCPPGMDAAETLIEAAIWHAINGNPSFFNTIMDRVDGKVKDTAAQESTDQPPATDADGNTTEP